MAHEDLTINGLSFIDAHLQVEGAPVLLINSKKFFDEITPMSTHIFNRAEFDLSRIILPIYRLG